MAGYKTKDRVKKEQWIWIATSQRRCTNSQYVYENISNIFTFREVQVKQYWVLPYPSKNGYHQGPNEPESICKFVGKTSLSTLSGYEPVQPLYWSEWRFPRKLTEVPFDPAIHLLGISERMKAIILQQKKTSL